MTANCRKKPDILAAACGHGWCAWRKLVLYYLLPCLVVIGLLIWLVPMEQWAGTTSVVHITYPSGASPASP